MWCVVHVKSGSETGAENFLSGLLSGELETRCFHLVRSRRKKYGGQWRTVRETLLPGDVFIRTEQPEAVCRELKKVSGIGLLTGSGEQVTALQWQEAKFMENIADREGRIGISKVGVAGDGRIRYLSGPLVKVGSMVKKVDLHKRTAEVETSFMGEKHVLYLGIELPGD